MFGIAVARLDKIDEAEKERYQALYCGLCRALKLRYGQVSRLSLSYDLVFMAMLYDSLYEPVEETGTFKCISHPTTPMPFAASLYTDYAADLSVALAYHKCLDDVADDNSAKAKVAAKALASSYAKAQQLIPDECAAIERSMETMRHLEGDAMTTADAIAGEFGALMATLFAHYDDIWTPILRDFGFYLGKFIYLMDAAVDLPEDGRSGSFNPFMSLQMEPEAMRAILLNIIGEAALYFERLPLVQDAHLMQCVLYSGVWQKFNQTYDKTSGNGAPNLHNGGKGEIDSSR